MKLIGKIFEAFFKYFVLVPAFIVFIVGTILSIINKSFSGLLLMISGLIVYLFLPELALLIGRYGFEDIWKQFGFQTKPDFARPWKLTKIVLLTSFCTAVIISILKIIETKNFFYLFGIPISGLLFYLVLMADKLIHKSISNKNLQNKNREGTEKFEK
ncbi:hypothetical protein [Caldicellulosiruptor acetigenus]|uniref:Uncharacterized protein n=1 Tax=Caldicellulosiruptor acetigenus 6A TaxID=632516 RepID=G2PX06_9FIRM|nr:hypothetical protein [Caldicellulosiruptor acetigenus]AEM72961.1 hypothetical protein Calla_0288 [Caldicellulosiruptor acetigenus 6A]